MSLSPATRRRLDIQGFETVNDAWLAEVAPWPRLAFGLCAAFAVVGTATASVGVLWSLVGIASLAAVFPVHPFDLIYNWGIRHLRGTRPIPDRCSTRHYDHSIRWTQGRQLLAAGAV